MSRDPADTVQTSTSFSDWRVEVDSRLEKTYCITIVDAGFDEQYLIDHWACGEEPSEFVEWFGMKYDLTKFRGKSDFSF